MFAVTILGNNSAVPTNERFPTAQVVTYYDQLFLIDCGEGTQMQMARYKIKRSKIQHIFISHLHGDHYFGLIGLLNSFSLMGRTQPLHLYAPPELKTIIELQLTCAATQLSFELKFVPLYPHHTGILIVEKNLQISYFNTKHRIPCFGFSFCERKIKRRIIPEQANRYQIPTYFYGALQEGKDYIGKDGTVVRNEWVTQEPSPGRCYIYCADTIYDEGLIPIIRGANLVYHETTYLQDQPERAGSRFHCTSVQAATLAKKAGVKKLLIGHFSSKYKDLSPFLEECRPIFPNTELALEGATFMV